MKKTLDRLVIQSEIARDVALTNVSLAYQLAPGRVERCIRTYLQAEINLYRTSQN